MAITIITIKLLMVPGVGLQSFMAPMGASGGCWCVCTHVCLCSANQSLRIVVIYDIKPKQR